MVQLATVSQGQKGEKGDVGGGTGVGGENGVREDLLPVLPAGQGPPTVSLQDLIEFAVNKTYGELTVMAELLPKRSDLERKINILQFAHNTRQLFIRLLALVKWLKGNGKINDLTGRICFLMDEQCNFFVDTADRLARLAREDLAHARLPTFQIPAAVDVLTLGSFPRLPVCIKSRFVQDTDITTREEAVVLKRLNQVIQYRLMINAATLPKPMRNLLIRNGMAKFRVNGEFDAWVTILGEGDARKWSLLHLEILVVDDEIGEGSELVHPRQLHYLHQLAQVRMNKSPDAIRELYKVMHNFCLSLKLDLLFCQATTLIHERLNNLLGIQAYKFAQKLLISYWRQPQIMTQTGKSDEVQYQICIEMDGKSLEGGLRVTHSPNNCAEPLPTFNGDTELSRGQSSLSLEALLTETCIVRARQKLKDLKSTLAEIGIESELSGSVAPTLTMSLLTSSHPSEYLTLALNLFTGKIVATVSDLEGEEVMNKFSRALNSATFYSALPKDPTVKSSAILNALKSLRLAIHECRCKRGLSGLPVRVLKEKPSFHNSPLLSKLSPHRMYIQFTKFETVFLVISFKEQAEGEFKAGYQLVTLRPPGCKFGISKQLPSLIPLDLDCMVESGGELDERAFQRRFEERKSVPKSTPPFDQISKVPRLSAGVMGEIGVVGSVCEHRIPFYLLQKQLDDHKIKYILGPMHNLLGGNEIRIIHVPNLPNQDLWNEVLMCRIRMVLCPIGQIISDRRRGLWATEIQFKDNPFMQSLGNNGSSGNNIFVPNQMTEEGTAKCVSDLIANLVNFSRLYKPVKRFAKAYNLYMHKYVQVRDELGRQSTAQARAETILSMNSNNQLKVYPENSSHNDIFSIDQLMSNHDQENDKIRRYAYFKIHVGYGPDFGYMMTLKWSPQEHAFHISFGVQNCVGGNPHSPPSISQKLLAQFNEQEDLPQLVQTLADTIQPLVALQHLSSDIILPRVLDPQQTAYGSLRMRFCAIPISPTQIRLLYRGQCAIEINMFSDGLVSIRDCFAVSGLSNQLYLVPLYGFAYFLMQHCEGRIESGGGGGSGGGHAGGGRSINAATKSRFYSGGVDHKPPMDSWSAMLGSPAIANSPSTTQSPLIPPSPLQLPAQSNQSPAALLTPSPAPVSNSTPRKAPGSGGGGLPLPSKEELIANNRPITVPHGPFLKICQKAHAEDESMLERYMSSVYTMKQYEKGLKHITDAEKNEDANKRDNEQRRELSELETRIVGPSVVALTYTIPRREHRFHFDLALLPPEMLLKLNINATVDYLTPDRLTMLDRYFNRRIRPLMAHEALLCFMKMIAMSNQSMLNAFLNLMKAELDGWNKGNWNISIVPIIPPLESLTTPNTLLPQTHAGTHAFRFNDKQTSLLFFIKLGGKQTGVVPLMFPIIYDMTRNNVRLYIRMQDDQQPIVIRKTNDILTRQSMAHQNDQHGECSIWPALRDLMESLEY